MRWSVPREGFLTAKHPAGFSGPLRGPPVTDQTLQEPRLKKIALLLRINCHFS
jgi:hypothetical protein